MLSKEEHDLLCRIGPRAPELGQGTPCETVPRAVVRVPVEFPITASLG